MASVTPRVATLAMMAVLSLWSARASILDVSPVATWKPRSLQQVAPQCTCLRSDFACTNSFLFCPAGTNVSVNLAQAFGCTVRAGIAAVNNCVGVDPPPVADNLVQCPGHLGNGPVKICVPGTSVNGGDPSTCKNCKTVTLIGTCDVSGVTPSVATAAYAPAWGRTKLTGCTKRVTCASADQVIDINGLGCAKTNNVDPTGGPLFWADFTVQDQYYYDMKAAGTLPTKIKCNDYLLANACTYAISAAPTNRCLNKANFVTVVVGNSTAPAPLATAFNPDACPIPYGP